MLFFVCVRVVDGDVDGDFSMERGPYTVIPLRFFYNFVFVWLAAMSCAAHMLSRCNETYTVYTYTYADRHKMHMQTDGKVCSTLDEIVFH